jgi:CheY-like chemotaxis protein
MRILIAEDDQVLADGLLRTLRASGAAVDHVADGSQADAALMTNTDEFDLLILDLGLPRMHGLEVLKKLRSRGSKLPVLILTAADSVEERVKGLDYGADDYMAKPFSLQELEARVRALVRRGMGGASSTIKHGPLVYDQGRTGGDHRRPYGRAVGARTGPAGGAAAARRPAGQQGPAGRAPVRMGRGSQQQRDRGVHPPTAQEDRERPDPHRHRARAGLLPGKNSRLTSCSRLASPLSRHGPPRGRAFKMTAASGDRRQVGPR